MCSTLLDKLQHRQRILDIKAKLYLMLKENEFEVTDEVFNDSIMGFLSVLKSMYPGLDAKSELILDNPKGLDFNAPYINIECLYQGTQITVLVSSIITKSYIQ